jgi:HAD superfamily hydrolase (TIGR01490 family)
VPLNPPDPRGLAFYDFDGTLVAGNVVDQYRWYARRAHSAWRPVRLAVIALMLLLADFFSRELFNRLFYREYRRFPEQWLRAEAVNLYSDYVRSHLYEGVEELLQRNREEGFVNVLVTGSLDFAMEPVVEALGFSHLLANRLEFARGRATGRMIPPVLAGAEKARAMLDLCRRYNVQPVNCRAYSDDTSDLPMLEAVGEPTATNPKPPLRRIAAERRWPILDLRRRI